MKLINRLRYLSKLLDENTKKIRPNYVEEMQTTLPKEKKEKPIKRPKTIIFPTRNDHELKS